MQKSRKKKLLEGGEIDALDDSSQTSDSRVNVIDPKTGEVTTLWRTYFILLLSNYDYKYFVTNPIFYLLIDTERRRSAIVVSVEGLDGDSPWLGGDVRL